MRGVFDEVIKLGANVKTSVNFLMGDITAYLKEEKISINESKLTPEELEEYRKKYNSLKK